MDYPDEPFLGIARNLKNSHRRATCTLLHTAFDDVVQQRDGTCDDRHPGFTQADDHTSQHR